MCVCVYTCMCLCPRKTQCNEWRKRSKYILNLNYLLYIINCLILFNFICKDFVSRVREYLSPQNICVLFIYLISISVIISTVKIISYWEIYILSQKWIMWVLFIVFFPEVSLDILWTYLNWQGLATVRFGFICCK